MRGMGYGMSDMVGFKVRRLEVEGEFQMSGWGFKFVIFFYYIWDKIMK